MRHTLQAEQQARALEAQLDALLLNELDESTVRKEGQALGVHRSLPSRTPLTFGA